MSLSWWELHFGHCPLSICKRKRFVVIPAIGTRFRSRSPLPDLNELTLMFTTLGLQYLKKLIEGKVRDFTSPKPFHTVKVQRFGCDGVKPSAKVGGKFPMPVSTLVADFAIEYSECSDSTPPVIRTFDFTRYCFIELPKCVQGLLMKLWRLYLLACTQCQIRVFHTEVCPYALTCCRQDFSSSRVCCDTWFPIVSTLVTL